MNKPTLMYIAITKAVDDYNNRHNYDRGHLADKLGFNGPHASNQFSNCINPNTTDKSLNSYKIDLLLHLLDHEARMIFFREWMRQFALKPVATESYPVTVDDLRQAADNVAIEGSESLIVNMHALSDGKVTIDEAKKMRKEASDVERAQGTYIRMLNDYIDNAEE
ncbi:hypothetical protein [Sulfurovum mangrovi]|uniref:hypothetical protein n=1 Tax=Sulfurovum mangrovi TaxID=2893889 RepID=UPI001E59A4E0|nr:hypothetical protein [Sulfurovum mangrovi]UFH59819.1 hypothetical protein LN246_03000 [Sulfurovum mangrovi]UFH59870.1 hypothetical protein LN246_03260 [Sulfurovum mangrovi]